MQISYTKIMALNIPIAPIQTPLELQAGER